MPASVTTIIERVNIQAGYDQQQGLKSGHRPGLGDPLLVHFDNLTDAGTLKFINSVHVPLGEFVAG